MLHKAFFLQHTLGVIFNLSYKEWKFFFKLVVNSLWSTDTKTSAITPQLQTTGEHSQCLRIYNIFMYYLNLGVGGGPPKTPDWGNNDAFSAAFDSPFGFVGSVSLE
jgi:hypothetical protein